MTDNFEGRIGFELMRADHLALFDGWIRTDHVRPWWGDPVDELEKVRDMIEGRDSTKPYMVNLDGRPVGYIQVWFTDDWRDEATLAGDPWVALMPKGCVGVDICIGEKALVGGGLGSAAVRLFTEQLSAEGHRTIIIDPDPENLRAVKAYARAGFRPVPELAGKTDGVLIMQFDPDTDTKPS